MSILTRALHDRDKCFGAVLVAKCQDSQPLCYPRLSLSINPGLLEIHSQT